MFKESDIHTQLDMFSSPTEYFKDSKKKKYLKNDSWHNQFRKEVVTRVDESIFSPLYAEGKGAPNASIRVLVGMMVLKEGQGWSDEQLFENCEYNLLTRSALGLMSLEDDVPAPSTYYLFRRNLVEHERKHGADLFKECQTTITGEQVLEFNVSGKQVRMDSKLVGSNIAWYSRYELLHETLRLFIEEREEFIHKRNLSKEESSLVDSIKGETGNKIKGYSVSITGTCDRREEDGEPVLNLITDTAVDVVSTPDNSFLPGSLDGTREMLSGDIGKVYADGAYNSVSNQEYCQGESIDLILTGIQGAPPRYDIKLDGQDGDKLVVTDNETGMTIPAEQVKTRKDKTKKKWKIKTGNGKYRYFDEQNIRTAGLRRKMKEASPEESIVRNNVEAGIFQSGYHYPNDKTRYRLLAKHKLWAYSRSLWINFVRIVNYSTRISQGALSGLKSPHYITKLCFNMYIIVNIFSTDNKIHRSPIKPVFSAF